MLLDLEDIFDKELEPLFVLLRKENAALIDQLIRLTGGLTVRSNGKIANTVENLKKLREIRRLFNNVVNNPQYAKQIENIKPIFDKLSTRITAYFAKTFDLAKDYDSKAVFKFLKEDAIEQTVSLLTNRGLGAVFSKPIENVLKQNISGGGTIDQLTEQLKSELGKAGATNQVFLERYLGQIAGDSVNEFSRNYINTFAEDLGLEWYLYEGKAISSSRSFCEDRANRYYHRSEVESWADLKWQGKIPQTNSVTIFSFVGGYNCRHYLIPVPESVVPEAVLARFNKNNQ